MTSVLKKWIEKQRKWCHWNKMIIVFIIYHHTRLLFVYISHESQVQSSSTTILSLNGNVLFCYSVWCSVGYKNFNLNTKNFLALISKPKKIFLTSIITLNKVQTCLPASTDSETDSFIKQNIPSFVIFNSIDACTI